MAVAFDLGGVAARGGGPPVEVPGSGASSPGRGAPAGGGRAGRVGGGRAAGGGDGRDGVVAGRGGGAGGGRLGAQVAQLLSFPARRMDLAAALLTVSVDMGDLSGGSVATVGAAGVGQGVGQPGDDDGLGDPGDVPGDGPRDEEEPGSSLSAARPAWSGSPAGWRGRGRRRGHGAGPAGRVADAGGFRAVREARRRAGSATGDDPSTTRSRGPPRAEAGSRSAEAAMVPIAEARATPGRGGRGRHPGRQRGDGGPWPLRRNRTAGRLAGARAPGRG